MENFGIKVGSTTDELKAKELFVRSSRNAAIPDREYLENLPLFLTRQTLMHILFLNQLYGQILEIHGSIMEFGVRWGRNLATLANLRAIYEPYNYNRSIVGFDTFQGFPSVSNFDLEVSIGDYGVAEGWKAELALILSWHEQTAPISHIQKFRLIQGDVSAALPEYLSNHPETVVAMAYLDLDLYEPTRNVLRSLLPRMPRGGVLVFDEVNVEQFPGETVALLEEFNLNDVRLNRSQLSPLCSWIQL